MLIREGLGFNEIEEFEMGLQSKFKSLKFKNIAANTTRKEGKVKEQAMKRKLADEQCYYRELLGLSWTRVQVEAGESMFIAI